MSGRFRKFAPLTLVLATGISIPATADATPCTRGYMQCLNDSYDLKGLAEYLANLECGVGFASCLRKMLI